MIIHFKTGNRNKAKPTESVAILGFAVFRLRLQAFHPSEVMPRAGAGSAASARSKAGRGAKSRGRGKGGSTAGGRAASSAVTKGKGQAKAAARGPRNVCAPADEAVGDEDERAGTKRIRLSSCEAVVSCSVCHESSKETNEYANRHRYTKYINIDI